jgi:hypothetical protein
MVRINKLYDQELARLRRLWAGAPAGSVPVTPVSNAGDKDTAGRAKSP